MAAKIEKPENDPSTTPNDSPKEDLAKELKLARLELGAMKMKNRALSTNFSRAQKKIAKLEDRPAPKDDSESHNAASDATTVSSSVPPAKSTTATVASSTSDSHVEHSMEWVPPFCGEHGCKNDLFKDEVVCNNCNGPLGSEHYAKHQLKACPLCGENKGYKPKQGYSLLHDKCTGPECRVK